MNLFARYDSKKTRAIIIGGVILVKLVLMGLFSSDYQDAMFIPFVDTFLSGQNPYTYYYEQQLLPSFPYFPLMLLIESVGGTLLRWFSPENLFLRNLLFKLPLLGVDLLGFWTLRRMPVRFKYAAVFYFCSPIVFYGTYMHGQLDIIPTALLLLAVYHLLQWKEKRNLRWFSVILGLAIATKFHIVAAVPLLLFYVMKKAGARRSLLCAGITTLTVAAFTIPFWGKGFVETVLLNQEQSVLLTTSIDLGSTSVAIPVLVLALVYLKILEQNYFNRDLLISMLGLLFAVFLICIPPMPAWYTWVVPFVALYFGFVTENKHTVMWLYAGYNLLYLIYFIFLHQTAHIDLYLLSGSLQNLKIESLGVKSAVFTLMTACFAAVIYKIYRFGIASNTLYKRKDIPFTIGIAGDSGAGKSRLLEKIERLFGTGKDILFIEGDGDHRWERNNKNWEKYTALDPQANYLYRQAKDIRRLRSGNSVERSEYDHDRGVFTPRRRVDPKKFIILCGLHSLYLPQLRKELDLKIFMDTDTELRNFWKIQRDTAARGYSRERILEQIQKRIPDAEKYIYPQKDYTDLVIRYFDSTLHSCLEQEHEVMLSVSLTVDINMDLERVLSAFHRRGVFLQVTPCEDFLRQQITFDGTQLDREIDFAGMAEEIIPQYEDVFTYSPQWEQGIDGIIQLFLLLLISDKMRG